MSKVPIPHGPYDLNARLSAPRRGQPAVVPVECYERERKRAAAAEQRIAALEAELAAANEREAALAAALEETDAAFEKFAAHHGPCCHVHNSTDETVLGECCLCDIDRDARQRGDYAPILARVRREAKREELNGLPGDASAHLLFSDGLYAQGWNAYRGRVVDALAALDAEEKGEQNG